MGGEKELHSARKGARATWGCCPHPSLCSTRRPPNPCSVLTLSLPGQCVCILVPSTVPGMRKGAEGPQG